MKQLVYLLAELILISMMTVAAMEAAAAPPAQPLEGDVYVVQLADRLSRLAEKYYGNTDSYPTIIEATNARAEQDQRFQPITNPDQIEVGQTLWIPEEESVEPVIGDSSETTGPLDQENPDQAHMDQEATDYEYTMGLHAFQFQAEAGDLIEVRTNREPEAVMLLEPTQYRDLKAGERVTFPTPISQTEQLTRLKVPIEGRWYVGIPDSEGTLEVSVRLIPGIDVNIYEEDELAWGMAEEQAEDFVRRVVAETNEVRQEQGCPPVTLNETLTRVAQSHSMNMALEDFFSHTGRDQSQAADRVSAAGYRWQIVAENLTAGHPTPEEAVEALMQSEGHRRNILNCDFEEIGVGVYYLADDPSEVNYHYYWTQIFASPLERD